MEYIQDETYVKFKSFLVKRKSTFRALKVNIKKEN